VIEIRRALLVLFCILLVSCTKTQIIESPSKIPRQDIQFYQNRTQINLDDYVWAYFNESETDSMYPAITGNSHAIGLRVDENTEIRIGDIISFKVLEIKQNYAHRVIEIGYDKDGEYFITKGDNNNKKDNIKVRREDISYVVAAIIY